MNEPDITNSLSENERLTNPCVAPLSTWILKERCTSLIQMCGFWLQIIKFKVLMLILSLNKYFVNSFYMLDNDWFYLKVVEVSPVNHKTKPTYACDEICTHPCRAKEVVGRTRRRLTSLYLLINVDVICNQRQNWSGSRLSHLG